MSHSELIEPVSKLLKVLQYHFRQQIVPAFPVDGILLFLGSQHYPTLPSVVSVDCVCLRRLAADTGGI
jgi:hypothetical protein